MKFHDARRTQRAAPPRLTRCNRFSVAWGSMPESDDSAPGKALGTIPLKQVRVTRAEMDEHSARPNNPMNRLVPYLDLFGRLSDAELARLAVVGPEIVAQLRAQVVAVDRALARYVDLLPRLSDEELMRLLGASAKTIRFWRLCQPRTDRVQSTHAPSEADAVPRMLRARAETAPQHIAPPPEAPRVQEMVPATPATRHRRPIAATPPAGVSHDLPPPRTDRVTPGRGSPAVPEAAQHRPTPTPPHGQPSIDITGAPFPGYDYDPNEPIPDELTIGVDLPDSY
jgi:hypothetical protein